MVTTKLWAQLGNQMFMISAVIGYSIKHKMNYFIPNLTIAPHIWKTYFTQFPSKPDPVLPYSGYFKYKEKVHSYTEIPFYNNIELDGYFQSEKYFSHCRQNILDAFQIPYKKIPFVSIHVRRGDYLQYADKHPPVTFEYIKEAVLYMIEKGYDSFVVCSDDIKWCRTMFKALGLYGATFSYSVGHEPIEDLAMMSCCEHNIIANSTFSWWSAWLNQNPDKIVIAPKLWFGPGNAHLETKDIIPYSWIKI